MSETNGFSPKEIEDLNDRFGGDSAITRNAEEKGLFTGILCARCVRGHLYRRRGKFDVIVRCLLSEGGIVVPPDIAECSDFTDKTAMSLYTMAERAVKIDPRPGVHDKAYL